MRGFFIISVFLLFVYGAVNAKEPIDSAKVVVDKNSEHGPWEDYQKPGFFNITSADRKRIKEAFVNDDPLSFIANEDQKFYIRHETEKMPDRDEYRKRMALAAYFTAHNKKADYRSVLSNLDRILEEKFNKKISIDQAFDDVIKSFGYSPRKIRMQKKIDSLRKFLTFEFLFPWIILVAVFCFVVWILRLVFRNRRKIIDFVKVCFSPEHYFQTSVLIIGSVIALSMFCMALKICL